MGAKEDNWERGAMYCDKCKHFAKSTRTPAMRCCHALNMRPSYLGTIYCQTPSAKNWDNKCKLYEEK